MKKVFYIDLFEVNSNDELHDLLVKELPLPDYYGRNLDALYDVLGEFGDDWNIIFYNTKYAKLRIGKYYEALKSLCADACDEVEGLMIRFYP